MFLPLWYSKRGSLSTRKTTQFVSVIYHRQPAFPETLAMTTDGELTVLLRGLLLVRIDGSSCSCDKNVNMTTNLLVVHCVLFLNQSLSSLAAEWLLQGLLRERLQLTAET